MVAIQPALGPDPVIKMVSEAKIQLLMYHSFIGQIAVGLECVMVNWVPRAATDGRRIYLNRHFILNLTPQQVVFLIAHEVLHCLLDHLFRCGGRDPKLYNMAIDYIVNYILIHNGIGEFIPIGLYLRKYTDQMTSEFVYNDLVANKVEPEDTLDRHFDDDYVIDGDPEPEQEIDPDAPPRLTRGQMEQNRENIIKAAISAMRSSGNNAPAAVVRMINELLAPKLRWGDLLAANLRSAHRTNVTFQRPSRRAAGTGLILPSRDHTQTVEIATFIDASASTTQQMVTEAMSEVCSVARTFRDPRITVGSFDTKVYNVQKFTSANLSQLPHYQITGKGGTWFPAIYDYLKANRIKPKRLIISTDGEPNDNNWGDANYCPTLFIIHDNPTKTAPYGITCHYETGRIHRSV